MVVDVYVCGLFTDPRHNEILGCVRRLGVEAPVGASLLFSPAVFTIQGVQGVSGAAVPHHAVPSGSPLSGALETLEPHDDDVCPMSAGGSDFRKSRVEILSLIHI